MKKSIILKSINDIRQQYKTYKDGGMSFIEHLANRVLNTVNEDKNEVINFFLDEIKHNENNYGEIALLTIVEMEAIEFAPNIERIYEEMASLKDEDWKHSIIVSLMKLRYTFPKSLYFEYITSYLKNHPDDGYFILVQYCNVDPDKALPMLSDFYSDYLLANKRMQDFLESRIGFLVSYFIKNPIDYFPNLIRQTLVKNSKAGLHLKNLLLNYLNSQMVDQYPKNIIKEIMVKLNEI